MGLIAKFNQWYVGRYIRKQQKKKRKEISKKQQEFVTNLKMLYNFVKWLNTEGMTNRKQRKIFWRAVEDNKPVLENVIKQLLAKYDPEQKPNVVKKEEPKSTEIKPKKESK